MLVILSNITVAQFPTQICFEFLSILVRESLDINLQLWTKSFKPTLEADVAFPDSPVQYEFLTKEWQQA